MAKARTIHHISPKRFAEICARIDELHKTYTDIGRCVEHALQEFKLEDGNGRWRDNVWYMPFYLLMSDDMHDIGDWYKARLEE